MQGGPDSGHQQLPHQHQRNTQLEGRLNSESERVLSLERRVHVCDDALVVWAEHAALLSQVWKHRVPAGGLRLLQCLVPGFIVPGFCAKRVLC